MSARNTARNDLPEKYAGVDRTAPQPAAGCFEERLSV
jgi:hypothetical protein